MKENFKGTQKMNAHRHQLTTYQCYSREELLLIRESKYCRTRPDSLSKDFDNDDGLFSPDKWLQHQWKRDGVENRVRRKAASQTSAGSGGGGGSVSGNSTTTTTANTPQDSEKQQASSKAARLRRGTSTASNGLDFKPDFQKSALEATSRPSRGNLSLNSSNNGGNGSSWSSTATTSKHGNSEKSKIRRGGGDRTRKSTERRRSSNTGDEPLPEWVDQGPESAFDIIELMGFEEDIQKTNKAEEEPRSSPETILPSLGSMTMATSRLKQWMGEGAISEPKGLTDEAQKAFLEAPSRCASSNNASSSGGGSSAIGPSKQIQQHIPFYEPSFDGIGMSSMPGPAGFYPHTQQTMGPPYLPPSRSPQSHFTPFPPPLVNNSNNSNITGGRSFLSSPVFLPNSGNHPSQGIHPLQMRHPFFGSNYPGGMGVPPMPGHGLHHNQHHVQQHQQQPLFPPYLSPSRSPHNQTQFPPPPPLVNATNHVSASRSFINSPAFMPPNHGNHPHQGVHPLQMRHPFFGSNGPGGMGVPPMPGHGFHYNQQQPVMPAHLPPSRSPQTQFPPLVNTDNQISANRSNHFNQNYNLLNSPAFMPTSVMRQMSKVPGGSAISTGSSETGSSTPNPNFSSGRSNIPPALEKIFASVRNQQTDRSMLVRAILGQEPGHDDPSSFSCSR